MTPLQGVPPPLTERLLSRALAATPYRDDIVGDLRESYAAIADQRPRYARCWYRLQAARLVLRYMVRLRPASQKRGSVMDRLFMQVRFALRSLARRPLMSATIVTTLALGF